MNAIIDTFEAAAVRHGTAQALIQNAIDHIRLSRAIPSDRDAWLDDATATLNRALAVLNGEERSQA